MNPTDQQLMHYSTNITYHLGNGPEVTRSFKRTPQLLRFMDRLRKKGKPVIVVKLW